MSKSGSFTLVLTVICLSVLMSLEADAQSTTDETNSCSSSSSEEVVNLVKSNALKLEENAKEIKVMKERQEEIKEQLAVNSSVLKEEIKKITSKSCESEAVEPSKQTFVSALDSEYLFSKYFQQVNVQHYCTFHQGVFCRTYAFGRRAFTSADVYA